MRDSKSSNFSHIEDIQIVARVLEGNTEAFSVLVQRHHEPRVQYGLQLRWRSRRSRRFGARSILKAFRALNRFRGQSLFQHGYTASLSMLLRPSQIQTSAQLCFSG